MHYAWIEHGWRPPTRYAAGRGHNDAPSRCRAKRPLSRARLVALNQCAIRTPRNRVCVITGCN
jgi:hypothetical protein